MKKKIKGLLKNLYRGLRDAGYLLLQPRTYLKPLAKSHTLTPSMAKALYQSEDPVEALILAGNELYPNDEREAVNWAFNDYMESLFKEGGTESVVVEDKETFRRKYKEMKEKGAI